MTIVTRMAPSPTGYLHIGGLRTALYNYLYAHQKDGIFLLRIEDTDRTRYVEGSIENLIDTLLNVWLVPDEGPNNPGTHGPYMQSERLDIYGEYIQKLIENDHAYYCFCSSERLDALRAEQQELGLPTKYDRKCRYLAPEEVQKNLESWKSFTIRLKVPDNTEISFTDTIRGKISVPSKDIDDQVLMKTDWFPTYHFAVVVDDHLMQVTDIIRGDEWIPSTPKHVLLYKAFGWEMPRFSHVPPLVGNDRKKLSKRTGDVSVEKFLELWFIPEAMLNYIALLGWNPKSTREIFSLEELVQAFKLEDVHRAGAVFDITRMEWFNAQYIMSYSREKLWNVIQEYLKKYNPEYFARISEFDETYTLKIIWELQSRIKKLSDFEELTDFFYGERGDLEAEFFINEKMKINSQEEAKEYLSFALWVLENPQYTLKNLEEIKAVFIEEIAKAGYKNGQILWPVRVALSNRQFSPGALELIEIFWKEKSIEILQKVLNTL